MKYLKENILAQVGLKELSQFLVLASVAICLPFFIHSQWITGPIVNAVLILSLFLLGIRETLILCLLPSLIALSSGLLPAVLAPVVPFIMISNVILILGLEFGYNNFGQKAKSFWLGLFLGAALKFTWLFFNVNLISKLLLKKELVIKIAQMMSWPQFYTAILGGIMAWSLLKLLKKI